MKRFQLLVIVSMIAAGAIWVAFYRSRHTSSTAVTALLPKDTLAFVHLPDFNRSRAELRQTDLYQIWAEPALQEFLQRPRARIPASDGLVSTLQECEALQMKDAFVAVLAIEYSAWKTVGGFRFKGDPGNAERIVENWKAKLLSNGTDFKRETVDYEGHQIQTDTAGIVRLSTVRDGQWFLVANDPEGLKPLLDRVDGRAKDPNLTLAADDLFATTSKRMPSIYTALAFARIDRLVEKLMPPANGDANQTDQLTAIRQIQGLCGATSFDGGKIRDTIFVGMPRLMDVGNLTRASLPIATKDTFLYATGFLNLTKPVPLPGSQGPLGWMGGLQRITGTLSSNGVTLESWNNAFGPELSWVGDWPVDLHWPSIVATLPVKDPVKAKEILSVITTANGNSTTWTHRERDGVHYFSMRSAWQFLSLSPTIGLSERILVVGADAGSVEAAMKRSANGNSELASSRIFLNAEHQVPTARQVFAYIDPALIYTRVDATLRPMLFMSAAFLPGISDTVDLNKLPAAEIITRHLSPIVMSQSYDGDGYLAESVGPITVCQTIVGMGGLGGIGTMLYQQHAPTRGPFLSPATPTINSAAPPSAPPSPSPGESPK
jgi:hypothetical protein